jgi:Putative metallopeptidase
MKIVLFAIATMLLGAMPAMARTNTLPSFMQNFTESQIRETIDFVAGNLMLVFFHEAGHMMIDERDLPVLSKEEDAVDTLATITLLEDGDEYSNEAVTNAAASWAGFGMDEESSGAKPIYWDVHGLAQQRAFNMACLMYGKDPKKFLAFADAIELPEERRATCPEEYRDLKKGWTKVLISHMRTSVTPQKFTVTYEETDNPELGLIADIIKDADLFSLLSNYLADQYEFAPGIKITAKECGIENAFWSPPNREITFCYELMALHAKQFVKANNY